MNILDGLLQFFHDRGYKANLILTDIVPYVRITKTGHHGSIRIAMYGDTGKVWVKHDEINYSPTIVAIPSRFNNDSRLFEPEDPNTLDEIYRFVRKKLRPTDHLRGGTNQCASPLLSTSTKIRT